MFFPEKQNRKWITEAKKKPESLQVRKSPNKKEKNNRIRFQKKFRRKLSETGKASVSSSGSLTLEAAFVLPLSLFFLLVLLSFFYVLRVQMKVQRAMEYVVGDVTGMAVYDTDTPLSSQALGNWYIERKIREELADVEWLEQISFRGNELNLQQSMVDVMVTYSVRIPSVMFPVPALHLHQRCRRKLWTGVSQKNEPAEAEDEFVYITETGTVYHRSRECSYLKLSVRGVSSSALGALRNESGEIYRPCELCRPEGCEVVYITESGNRYHKSLDCSGLKRQIRAIFITEVGDRTPCSRCGGEEK
jgi:hypothetical protein